MEDLRIIIWGGIVFFFKDLIGKAMWSAALYACRGELNHDNDEATPDKYLYVNPSTDKISIRYVMKYTILGVHWGFFYDDKFVTKFSFWLDWAEQRNNRFPWPIQLEEGQTEDQILKLLKRR